MRASRVIFAVVFVLFAIAACNSTTPPTRTASPPPAVLPTTPSSTTAVVTPAPASAAPAPSTAASTPTSPVPEATPTTEASPSSEPSGVPSSPTSEIAGSWSGTWQDSKVADDNGTFEVTFQQTGSNFTGPISVSGACISQGTVSGSVTADGTISFGAVKGAETIAFDGTVNGDSMSGTFQAGPACANVKGTWSATR